MVKLAVKNLDGKENEKFELPDELCKGRVKSDVIHQAVVMYQASFRQGTADTKERAEISGGGKKPFRQKGTGRARAGSTRSPLWKKGGIIFGPQPRDFSYTLPKKLRIGALRESLKSKFQAENLHCIIDVKQAIEKTKDFSKILKALKIEGKTLAILDGSDPSVNKASRNIRALNLTRAQDVNAYDVMRNKNILISKTALQSLVERITK